MVEMTIGHFEALDYSTNEAVNTLCTNLSFAGGDIRKIMITSCLPQEGKSFVAINLLRSMAKLGMRVILVDADIRASNIRSVYDVHIKTPDNSEYMGLTRYLAGKCSVDDIIGKTNLPNAWMILPGKNVINSLQLFNTPRLEQLLDELAAHFDLVLVDSPPVGTIIDAARIGSLCDGALFVVKSGAVTKQGLLEGMQRLEKAGCPMLGCVLNHVKEQHLTYYRSSYNTARYAKKQTKSSASQPSGFRKSLKGTFAGMLLSKKTGK